MRIIARTSDAASVEKGDVVDLSVMRPWRADKRLAKHALAAVAEGRLKSAFRNGKSARTARVLLIASASPFANAFVGAPGTATELEEQLAQPYAQQALTNAIVVLKNMLAWMATRRPRVVRAADPLVYRSMDEAPDTRIVNADCVAWSTKASGKPEGGADSKPVDVRKDTVVVVYGVSVETAPRSLLVRATIDGAERTLEIREQFLVKPTQ